jgi:ornithine cyclodeaminase/alanine dehydrogenase-like protein (mu-crystallin family)
MLSGRLTSEYMGMGGSSLFLPSLHTEQRYFGLKQASVFPANRKKNIPSVLSQYFLYSAETGELVSLLNFEDLTNFKTAATAAIATKHLARKDSRVLSIFGSGALARAVLAAVIEVRPIDSVRIYDLSQKRAEDLIAWAKEKLHTRIDYKVPSGPGECIAEADIVCTCTTSFIPVFDGGMLPAGCHLNAMGAWKPEMQEIDAITLQRASKIYCDVIDDTWQEAGDLIVPRDAGQIDMNIIHGELGALLIGKLTGRETPDEITLYESVGFGVLDLAVAFSAYRVCRQAGVGLTVEW